jgi:hypothetical protein
LKIGQRYNKIVLFLILFLVSLLYMKYVFLLILFVIVFWYKFSSVRLGIDHLGLDPFLFSSFYVGHVYGVKVGLIFGLLFGLAYVLSQVNISIRCFYFPIILVLVGVSAGIFSFIPYTTAGLIIVYFGLMIDFIIMIDPAVVYGIKLNIPALTPTKTRIIGK